jgi:hypothetical protein
MNGMNDVFVAGPCGIKTDHRPHSGKRRDGSGWSCDGKMISIQPLPVVEMKETVVDVLVPISSAEIEAIEVVVDGSVHLLGAHSQDVIYGVVSTFINRAKRAHV